ncbi:MAG: hypothetical protein K6G62_02760 [Eubacterium sp.]|nr:hypothetical protein [Eubacterium sp.]
MKRWSRRFCSGLLILALGVQGPGVMAKEETVRVSSLEELETWLARPGDQVLELERNIGVTRTLKVKGTKLLRGRGREIYRLGQSDLLRVAGATLVLDKVKISGRKKKARDRATALSVGEGGMVLMKGGSLEKNYNVAGGPAVCIQEGGTFELQGGSIKNNRATGQGRRLGRDARGGAILNFGKCIVTFGSLKSNCARGIEKNHKGYGGVGGAIYNAGQCYVQKGEIKRNQASSGGGGIYSKRGSHIWIRGGSILDNTAKKGKDLYIFPQTLWGEDNGTIGDVYEFRKEKKPRVSPSPAPSERPEPKKDTEKSPAPRETKGPTSPPEASPKARQEAQREEVLQGEKRYFFDWEVRNFSRSQWAESLGVEEGSIGGQEGFLTNQVGVYEALLEGKNGRTYRLEIEIVKEGVEEVREKEEEIRFCKEGSSQSPRETWFFSREDLEEIKAYLEERQGTSLEEFCQTLEDKRREPA